MIRRVCCWSSAAALAASAISATAAAGPQAAFELGMNAGDAARFGQIMRSGSAIQAGSTTAIICQGLVVAVQEELGGGAADYERAAADLRAKAGEGQHQVSAASLGSPEVETTYWDLGNAEIVLTRFSALGVDRVFRTTQLPGLPGCD